MPNPLPAVVATFQRWLYLPDAGPIYVNLAAVQAHRTPGIPVWVMNVAPPSTAKTEILEPFAILPEVYTVDGLTEAALLSGVGKKDRASDAKGGLLRVIGDSGILLFTDFGAVLSMQREARNAVVQALRRLYDGRWTRDVGTEGHRQFSWRGRLGFIGASTPAIDRHHGVIGRLGERFTYYRLDVGNDEYQAERALVNSGREEEAREEMRGAVERFFSRPMPPRAPDLDPWELIRTKALARLAVRARSAVERDDYRREVEDLPSTEGPARFVKVLSRLFVALLDIGVDREQAQGVVRKVAGDSVPKLRWQILRMVAEDGGLEIQDVRSRYELPDSTVRRALEDLTMHGLLTRTRGGLADYWGLTDLSKELIETADPF